MLVHTITKYYYSRPSRYQDMQGDAKLHHALRMGCLRDVWGYYDISRISSTRLIKETTAGFRLTLKSR